MSTDDVVQILEKRFPEIAFSAQPLLDRGDGEGDQICARVPPDRLIEVMTFLRDDERTHFEQLADLTCVDYLHFPKARDRYGVTYNLASLTHGHRLWVKCFANDPNPEVPSVTSIWAGADWPEREVYDLFGIRFTDHPDLRRIMTWDGFEAHPLRKDYPLRGQGERQDYDVVTRESS